MIPGGIGIAFGLLFILAALASWSLGIWFAAVGIVESLTLPRAFRRCDSGTIAVCGAGGFVLFMLAAVATA